MGASAESAVQVLPLDLFKQELRLPLTELSLDLILTGHIASAVAFVSRVTGRELVARDATFELPAFPAANAPIVLPRDTLSLSEISYWSTSAGTLEAPDATVQDAALGRFERRYRDCAQYGHWPGNANPGQPVLVAFRAGLQDTPPALRAIAILVARDLFEGQRVAGPHSLIARMLQPYLPYGFSGPLTY